MSVDLTEPVDLTGPQPTSAVVPLTEPAGGVPPVVTTPDAFAKVVSALRRGRGPVAADTERASGYRYGQRAYLVQIRRQGLGTALIDPIAIGDLSPLVAATGDAEWVLHAASQDLPCLAAIGVRPPSLFDTELAGRLLGLERVGLGYIVAEVLGLGLAKEHSAVDWSTRPLRPDWLRYAALDVEVLLPLRDHLEERLAAAGKLDWALQEFEAVRTTEPPGPRPDAWRRTSGIHAIRDQRRLAVVRSLWQTRDTYAMRRDVSPGRVLPDRAIIAAAKALPRTVPALLELPEFNGKSTRRAAPLWHRAIAEALALPLSALPDRREANDAPPPPRVWPERDAAAHRRLTAARALVADTSTRLSIPAENLLQPDALRRLCWNPPMPDDAAAVSSFLAAHGARVWQRDLLAADLATAFRQAMLPATAWADGSAADAGAPAVDPGSPAVDAGSPAAADAGPVTEPTTV